MSEITIIQISDSDYIGYYLFSALKASQQQEPENEEDNEDEDREQDDEEDVKAEL